MRELVTTYVKRVKELADHVRGNEQATKQSLIGPFFTMLGYDLTDPRECMPEYKADFGKDRSTKPIDWAFLNSGSFAFFVEAKEVGKRLAGFDEQLADYFAKDPNVKLGILTNGAQWRFFTDVVNGNVMDREPFAKWDVLSDEPPPYDFLTILTKPKFNPELIRAYAQRLRVRSLLVGELTRLLEPSPEFTRLAIANIETRKLLQQVVEEWKPIVAGALNEWSRQRMLTAALTTPPTNDNKSEATAKTDVASKVETTAEELQAFAVVQRLLGHERPIAYEDSLSYLKLHLAEKRTWVFARLQVDRKQPVVWVPLSLEQTTELARGRPVAATPVWTSVTLDSVTDLDQLDELFLAAYSQIKAGKAGVSAA
ncbi:MAG: hypothetical protein RL701_3144 [Pseudomonadota bacterium]